MRYIENIINSLTDMDWQWWPYLSLRPEKHEEMNSLFIMRVTAYYTPIFGVLSVLLILLMPNVYFMGIASPLPSLLASLLFFAIAFFTIMRLLVATAWNSRARRLKNQAYSQNLVVG